MTEQFQFDINSEFENRNYKSCFARTMAVNSQYNQPNTLDYKQVGSEVQKRKEIVKKEAQPIVHNIETEEVRLRKATRNTLDETRRYSCGNLNTSIYSSIRRSSLCSNRITEIPVENMMNQSKLETLQWQLKEIQKSREMYRAVMKQVVTYLEKAHHSLELLGSRINRRNSVHRLKCEQADISRIDDTSTVTTINQNNSRTPEDHVLKDLQWKQSKPEEPSAEEIPPDKLAQEAFRLLRTAQSLLNTREPDLAQTPNCGPTNDIEFLEQLAKEFPPPEIKPQRATSFSLSPKLIVPEIESKSSTAFNRKLSLQLNDVRRTIKSSRNVDSARGSLAESDTDIGNDGNLFGSRKTKTDKSNSPANGSISSVEDESGFSSMNSFQEVGLPIVNSTMVEEVSTKNALLRSMLHNNSLSFSPDSLTETVKEEKTLMDDIRLWEKPTSSSVPTQHKRWSSTPVKETKNRNFKATRNTLDETRRYSCGNLNTSIYSSIRRSSLCSNRITEIPVENMMNQSKLETLQWQLKEIQKSREMYRAVMKQVVTYLEKAHHSLELLGSRINRRNSVHRLKCEQADISRIDDTSTVTTINQNNSRTPEDHVLKDLQWKQSKPEEPSAEEIPPDKLAQEAFRLLRTAQSLLNTREPDLAQTPNCGPTNDIEFLEQLAKEFPPPEIKPQRATSFSLSPKLIVPEIESKSSTAFNRKLSLQLNDVRRTIKSSRNVDSARGSLAESDTDIGNDGNLFGSRKTKTDKSNSPANGSISSVEDESGFSSMNSFQEVGLPIVNSTMVEEVSTKNALLRSMLHNNSLSFSPDSLTETVKEEKTLMDDIRLWEKPTSSSVPTQHKRWSSTPVKETKNRNFKVLWV